MSNIHKNFNSRTRVGATRHILHRQARYQFQFTHPCGCDWGLAAMDGNPSGFNSRTRVGATPGGCGAGIFTRFQFTHPCGCDQPYAGVWGNPDVSIHAPVWVRPGPYSHHKTHKGSNSRTRVGATAVPTPSRRARTGFNSRTRVGATRGRRKQETPYTEFQFTHPCGCDPPCLTATHPATRFNSRTRVGATLGRPYLRIPDSVSIHAPVWVRRHTLRTVRRVRGFQFTHPCGCDMAYLSPCP